MRTLNILEAGVVSGGAFPGMNTNKGHPKPSVGLQQDMRNDQQKAADQRAEQAKDACSALANAFGCSARVDALNYQLQSEEYAICIATGGSPGPNDCGQPPSLPK